jgi:uncharacterized protein YcnI
MSSRRTFARFVALPAAVIGFSALAVAPALAHVTISPSDSPAGGDAVATVSVPHGCDGSPTTSIAIKIPDQLVEVTPTRNPFWDVKISMTKLAKPLTADDGDQITEKVDEIVYTAKTPLPADQRDTFQLSFDTPTKVGERLDFPTIQKCVKGETDWTELAAAGAAEPEHPAPTVTVVAASSEDGAATPATPVKASSSDDDGASKGLAYTGLGVGIVGLLTGAGALAAIRRKA